MTNTLRLRDLAISDSGFIFDPITGHTFTVNPTGKAVLEGLKADKSVEAIIEEIAEGFEPDGGEDIGRDVNDFIARLRDQGLTR